jgi:chromosome segregation ATPase
MSDQLAVQPKPELESRFSSIRAKVTALIAGGIVGNKLAYTELLQTKADLTTYVKAVGFELDPGLAKAKELLDHLKQQKQKFVGPAEEEIERAKIELKKYITEEERLAREESELKAEAERRDRALKAEQERIAAEKDATEKRQAAVAEIRGKLSRKEITKREAERLLRMAGANEEADKAAAAAQAEEKKNAPAPKIEVKADIPKVAGAPRGRSYKFQITDADKVPRQWCKPDEVKIGEFVRHNKNSATSQAMILGIKAWDEPQI